MRHSYTSQALAKQNGLAVGHRYWFAFPWAVRNLPIPRGSLPSGQLISSAEDMAHYLIAHLNGGRYGGNVPDFSSYMALLPVQWTTVGAAHPASADPKSVGSPHPHTDAGQNARLSEALQSRRFVGRPDLR
jgi:hypothetical protein